MMTARKKHIIFRRRKKKKRFLPFFTIIFIFLVGFWGWKFIYSKTPKTTTSKPPVITETKPVVKVEETDKEIEKINIKTEEQLTQEINSILASYPAVISSVSFIDLQTDKQLNFGTQEPFTAASTTKLLTAACYLDQVEKGIRSLTEMMGGYQAKWQLKQMINRSNNNSWELFNIKLGYSRINEYGHSIGLPSVNFFKNTITASDQAIFLKKLYSNEILSQESRDLIFSYMYETNNEDLIPAGLPDGTTVYHKYGALVRNLHDSAIIKNKDKVYVLTVYTNSIGSLNYDQRMELFHSVTQSVHSYME